MKVKSTETQMLTKSQKEAILSPKVRRSKVRAPPGEERVHRRAMQMALDILEEKTHLSYSSTLHKGKTTTPSPRALQKTPRARPPKKSGELTEVNPRSHGNKVEFSKYLVVSLRRCDSLLQKYTGRDPARSEMEPTSPQTLRACPPKKSGELTEAMPRSHGNGGVFSKFLVVSLTRCDSLLQKYKGRDPARSEMEPTSPPIPRACPPKKSGELTEAMPRSYGNGGVSSKFLMVSLTRCDSQLQKYKGRDPARSEMEPKSPQTPRACPPKKSGELTEAMPRSHGNGGVFSKFLVVSLTRCDSLLQKCKGKDPCVSEREPRSPPSTRASQDYPLLLEDGGENEHQMKPGTSGVASPKRSMIRKRGACVKPQQHAPIWPSSIKHRGLKSLAEVAQDTCPKTLAHAWENLASSQSTEDVREHPWKLHASGTATPSTPNIRPASRKRKLHDGEVESRPQKRPPTGGTEDPGPFKSKEKAYGRKGSRPAGIGFPKEPRPLERGMVVWFKFQDFPYWPAVVASVQRVEKAARVLLMEAFMDKNRQGIRVPLRRLKPFDCPEKTKLEKRARKVYGPSVDWCCSLVAHYREGVSRGSFEGSFLEYFFNEISYPIRKAIQEGEVDGDFPRVNYDDLEESEEEEETQLGRKRARRKLLPDRMRAARDRENQKLLDFIVRRRGVESHLLDIVNGRKRSTWLESFLSSKKGWKCVETYLEDDDQLFILAKYLQTIYQQRDSEIRIPMRHDHVSFIMEVLLPEALIHAISALEGLDYKDAETKYLKGPPIHYREKQLFDKKVMAQRRRRLTTGIVN